MPRTAKDIRLPNDHEGVLQFVQDWFEKKNFDILAKGDTYLRMERIRFGWICFEFWILEGEHGPHLHFEACVKALFKFHGQEWEIKNNRMLAQRWPLKMGNEYLAEFIPDLHSFLNGQVVAKEYEDTKYQKEFNEVIPAGGTIWRRNMMVSITISLVVALIVAYLVTPWIPGVPDLLDDLCLFPVIFTVLVMTILVITSMPLKLGFSHEFIIVKYVWQKHIIYWDAIVDDNGFPLLIFGEKGLSKSRLFLHMYGGPPYKWPAVPINITHEFQSRYVKRRNARLSLIRR